MSLTSFEEEELACNLVQAWSPYVPYPPTPKQLAFCMLPHSEALYGGAAGGGKSDALLMAALQYCHVPYYNGIIFRLSLTDLQQGEGLLTRAHAWLDPYPEIRYIPSLHCFVFPSGARLTFGYMGNYNSWLHYQGSAYQFIGWDELTQQGCADYYKEMISRLRRLQCKIHGGRVVNGKRAPLPDDPDCQFCQMYAAVSRVPLRIRSTANPGGPGHLWVKDHWKIHFDKVKDLWVSGVKERPFIPANYLDNPNLDTDSYGENLDQLEEARCAQLKYGDWDKVAMGRYKHDWFRSYLYDGGYYILLHPETNARTDSFHQDRIRTFCTVDVACSVRTGVAGEQFYKNRNPSWTVIGTYGITPNGKLLVLNIERFQEESPYLFPALRATVQRWKPLYVGMDATGPGLPMAQLAAAEGIPVKEMVTVFDKIANSVEAQNHVKAGRVYIQSEAPWRHTFLGELCCWTGDPRDVDDQVDSLSNAGHEYTLLAGNQFRDQVFKSHMTETPLITMHHKNILFENDALQAFGGRGGIL